MTETLHIGFTGTRHGMTYSQHAVVWDLIMLPQHMDRDIALHHGCCVGADDEIAREASGRDRIHIVGHPVSITRYLSDESLSYCDEIMQPTVSYMKRNAAIVNASQVMIAAPYESEPQKRGGTWATIGMARKALRRGLLRELYVVGRDGVLLDHTRWP